MVRSWEGGGRSEGSRPGSRDRRRAGTLGPMSDTRRGLLRNGLTLGAAALAGPACAAPATAPAARARARAAAGTPAAPVRPPRLRPGDRVGLVSPATAAFDEMWVDVAMDGLRALGLEPVLSPNFFARRGYFAGADEVRAADIMGFVEDPEVKGIWARGGWGSARVLPHLDFDAIARNPKVIVGYSDATALLSGIQRRTGLVVFHGPFPVSEFTRAHQRGLLIDGDAPTLSNPQHDGDGIQREDRIRTIRAGVATGRLVGGNLTVLTSIVGTPYVPEFDGGVLFVEDVDEAVYRIDRMLTQLALSGSLERIAGFVFGRCTECPPGNGYGSLTLEDVIRDHIEPLGVPAFRGSMIGHIDDQFTLPLGEDVEVDAGAGTLRLLRPGVA